ncbi:hypothetical protein [Virgibacillus alimentarius]|uniref:hypothetical protein n=1 Tax=Virgibacillus alimentarius TaxID=698769 RepID=UPI0012EBC5ED|nr:hypothetical protein [Virgibacillus alimentarius]
MEFVNMEGFPDSNLLNKILILHEKIFKDSDTLISKAKNKAQLVFTVGLEEHKMYVAGY